MTEAISQNIIGNQPKYHQQSAIINDIMSPPHHPSYPLLCFIYKQMRNYIYSKTPSAVDPGWLYWTTPEFKKMNPDSDQVAAFLFVTRKKEIGVLYKPTPVLDADKNKLLGIIGNMLEEGSTPAIIKIDGGEIGSCFMIQIFEDIPENFRPEVALQPEMLKESEWANAMKDLALVVIPTLAPLPFRKEIESTMLDDDFINEMMKLSPEHGFWEKMMADVGK